MCVCVCVWASFSIMFDYCCVDVGDVVHVYVRFSMILMMLCVYGSFSLMLRMFGIHVCWLLFHCLVLFVLY